MPHCSLSAVQSIPAGSWSVTTTSNAVPGPSFQALIVNAAVSPARIGLLAAVLLMRRSGQSTWTWELSSSRPLLEVATVAVLCTVPQVADVLGLVMWTLMWLPDA